MNSFYEEHELKALGFRRYGRNLKISRKASIYSPENISIGDNVRVDDFCILSGNIILGSYIHISAYTALYALNGITLEDFVTVSGRVTIYSQSDDYSGSFMTNPMVPAGYNHITGGPVLLRKHSIIAAGSVVLPSVIMGEGSCLGAMSLLKCDAEPWSIYAGVPAKRIKDRSRDLLKLEQKFLNSLNQ
ncbi:MAG: acyltransferase [Bacteroidales bacterium]|nr:acyltransferase [Bacteroidales bacterium]